jgi:hypothetical protein
MHTTPAPALPGGRQASIAERNFTHHLKTAREA